MFLYLHVKNCILYNKIIMKFKNGRDVGFLIIKLFHTIWNKIFTNPNNTM